MSRVAGGALALLCASWAATLWLGPWADERVSDLFVYRELARAVLGGALLYRDAFFEYPPLAALAIVLPGLIDTGEEGFRVAFAVWTLVLAAAVLLLTGRLAARGSGSPGRAMLAVALAPLLLGALMRTHLDLAPVALTLGALLLVCAGRPRPGLAVLGAAVMTKGYPLVVAPVALAWLVARGDRRAALEGAAALALVVAMGVAGALALSPNGAIEAVAYQIERPVQIESSPASLLLALDGVGLREVRHVASHRSDGLLHPLDLVLSLLFGVAFLCVLAVLTAAAGGRSDRAPPDERQLVLAALAATAAFAALGKVLSPQFLIWVVPLGALAFAWRMRALAAAITAAALLTFIEFPSRYRDVVAGEPFATSLVALRNTLLLAALALTLRALSSRPGAAVARLPGRARRRRPRPAPR